MNTLSEFITTIKRELLLEVIMHMKQKAMSGEIARDLAKEFLQGAPFTSKEEVLQKLSELGVTYEEARTVFLKYAPRFYEERRGCLVTNIRASIEQGDIDKAVEKAYMRCSL